MAIYVFPPCINERKKTREKYIYHKNTLGILVILVKPHCNAKVVGKTPQIFGNCLPKKIGNW